MSLVIFRGHIRPLKRIFLIIFAIDASWKNFGGNAVSRHHFGGLQSCDIIFWGGGAQSRDIIWGGGYSLMTSFGGPVS